MLNKYELAGQSSCFSAENERTETENYDFEGQNKLLDEFDAVFVDNGSTTHVVIVHGRQLGVGQRSGL